MVFLLLSQTVFCPDCVLLFCVRHVVVHDGRSVNISGESRLHNTIIIVLLRE